MVVCECLYNAFKTRVQWHNFMRLTIFLFLFIPFYYYFFFCICIYINFFSVCQPCTSRFTSSNYFVHPIEYCTRSKLKQRKFMPCFINIFSPLVIYLQTIFILFSLCKIVSINFHDYNCVTHYLIYYIV